MLDIYLLGTEGMMPSPYRWLTSTMAKCLGSNLLIGCSEETWVVLKRKGWNLKPVDIICLTHYHADHIGNLPGLLFTMGDAERVGPLTLIGPEGLERMVEALYAIAPELSFELRSVELMENREHIQMGPYMIDTYRVSHNVLCYGYPIIIPRTGRFNVERAKSREILQKFWNRLQKGEGIEREGRLLTPDMVLGSDHRGLRMTYRTDTRSVSVIVKYAAGTDFFICEGMYGEKGRAAKTGEYKYVAFCEAAALTKQAGPKQMQLTHYNPSLARLEGYMEEVRTVFPGAKTARGRWTAELEFDED